MDESPPTDSPPPGAKPPSPDLTRLFGLAEGGDWLHRAALAAGATPHAAGRLGAYEDVQELARGGQGTVYQARQPVTGRTVAIKRVGSLTGERALARFEREVEAATRLAHPNVVTVHGAEVIDGHAVIIMEYVDGQPIDDWAARIRAEQGPGAWRTILRAGISVASGLAHAHQRGVIHRDLKPSNVLVGKDGRPRVLDFGIARIEDLGHATITEFAGTPQFASPEQLAGQAVDVRTDVYSLGVLLYELLTGERAFGKTQSLASLVDAIRRGLDTRVSRSIRGLPRDLDWVLARATATTPDDRYPTMEALARDLRGVLDGAAIDAHPPSVLYTIRKSARRHWVAVALSLTITAALATTSLVLWDSSRRIGRALADAQAALDRESLALQAANDEREIQQDVTEMLLEIPRAANPATLGHRPSISLLEAIEYAARERLQASYNHRPEAEAAFCKVLGEIYQGMGRPAEATVYLTRAIDRYTEVFGPGASQIEDPALRLSRITRDAGDYERAAEAQARIVAVRRAAPDAEIRKRYIAQALNSLGITLRRLGRLEEAEATLLEALDLYIQDVGEHNENVALVSCALASLYTEMGRLDEAEACAHRAFAVLRTNHQDETHFDFATAYRALGEPLAAAGRHEEAEAAFRRAIEIFASVPGSAPHVIATAHSSLARLLEATDRPAEATEHHETALTLLRGVYAPDHPRIAESEADLARVRAHLDQSSTMATPTDTARTDATASPAPPADLDAWNAWHQARIARLTADDGWLTLIDLAFLEEGSTSIGRAASNTLRYQSLTADHLGQFVMTGKTVLFTPHPAAAGQATADNRPVTDTITLTPDDQGSPTVLRDGPVSLILVRRNARLALRVRDNASPIRTSFAGIERFPFDPALRIPARIEPASPGTTIPVTNVLGFVEDQPLAATLVFTLGGQEFRFAATAGGPNSLFVCFADTTNGPESYGAGRFLDVPLPDPSAAEPATTTIDFNRAYNPPCSFTAFATCPLPVPSNRLPIPIRAGERKPAIHE